MRDEIIKDDSYILATRVIAGGYAKILNYCKKPDFIREEIPNERDEFQFLIGKKEMSTFWYGNIGRKPAKCHELVDKLFQDLLILKNGGSLER